MRRGGGGGEGGRGERRRILASWKVFFSKAENLTTLLCASTKMVNCRMLMEMTVHMLLCLHSHYFPPVVLCLVLRPFLGYSLGDDFPVHRQFSPAHVIILHWYSVLQRSRESRHRLSIVVDVILHTGDSFFQSYCLLSGIVRSATTAITDLQGTIRKAIQCVVIKSNFIFLEIII